MAGVGTLNTCVRCYLPFVSPRARRYCSGRCNMSNWRHKEDIAQRKLADGQLVPKVKRTLNMTISHKERSWREAARANQAKLRARPDSILLYD